MRGRGCRRGYIRRCICSEHMGWTSLMVGGLESDTRMPPVRSTRGSSCVCVGSNRERRRDGSRTLGPGGGVRSVYMEPGIWVLREPRPHKLASERQPQWAICLALPGTTFHLV